MIRLRDIKENDIYFLYSLANDNEVRKSSLKQEPIPYNEHKKWFYKKLTDIKNLKSKLFIIENNNKNIGQIRLDKKGVFHIIDISLLANYRGQGLSKTALIKLLESIQNITILAYVKNSNNASKSLFMTCGFKKAKECKDLSFYKVKT